MVDMHSRQRDRTDDGKRDADEQEDLGDKLKAISDRIGCAANAPLKNFGKDVEREGA